mmetsp:Transcript_24733/g.38544  ORF Transcript_24733/g.38544 Transcript_24733/m.38544 type:complete len:83 (-) Transcript_24733:42-290(-)
MSSEGRRDTELFLRELCGKKTLIRLKWGNEFVGTLVSSDSYMNVHLTNCFEKTKSQGESMLGDVLIRCNNILFILGYESQED